MNGVHEMDAGEEAELVNRFQTNPLSGINALFLNSGEQAVQFPAQGCNLGSELYSRGMQFEKSFDSRV